MGWNRWLLAVLIVCLCFVSTPVAAQDCSEGEGEDCEQEGEDEEDDSGGLGDLLGPLETLVEEFTSFTEDFDQLLIDVLIAVFFKPFQYLAETLVNLLTAVITSYPSVTREDVLELHALMFRLSLLLSAAAFLMIGYVYLTGSLLWIGYENVRPLIPRLFAALMFGGVAPWLLDYPVQLAELVTTGLKPVDSGFWVVTQLTSELMVIVVLNAIILLGISVLFIIRDVYLLFATVAAPLLALGWSLPCARRYANPLIGAFWGFLLIGPIDMILFRLILALLEVDAFEFPHWLWALGGLILMLVVPYAVVSTGASAGGMALAFIGGASLSSKTEQSLRQVNQQENPHEPREYQERDYRSDRRGNRFTEGYR